MTACDNPVSLFLLEGLRDDLRAQIEAKLQAAQPNRTAAQGRFRRIASRATFLIATVGWAVLCLRELQAHVL